MLGHGRCRRQRLRPSINKSFCAAFFKKRLLTSLRTGMGLAPPVVRLLRRSALNEPVRRRPGTPASGGNPARRSPRRCSPPGCTMPVPTPAARAACARCRGRAGAAAVRSRAARPPQAHMPRTRSARVFDDMHAGAPAVDEVQPSVLIGADVVRLDRARPFRGGRHEAADFLRPQRVGDIHRA